MSSKISAAPKPRAGTQRHIRRPPRITPLSRGTTPTLRATTPHRQLTPSNSAAPSRSKIRECPNPECPQPDVKLNDDLSGWACQTCGAMLEEAHNLVAETQFQEAPSGRIQAQGHQIGAGQTHQRPAGKVQGTGNVGQEATTSRNLADRHAKEYMHTWLQNLKYPLHEAEAGLRIFGLAWSSSFIKGRSLKDTAIVSLYLALRRQRDQFQGQRVPKYPVMLMDFAAVSDTDVFFLGKMYTDLVRKLYGDRAVDASWEEVKDLQAHGPETLIPRFVKELDFPPESSRKIRDDAMKIMGQMKRDWIHHGRRPSGVCGAAVILAARMNNHRRSTREVVLTAKVTEITLNKRLEEFSELPSSQLSVNDFRNQDVREAFRPADPPAFTKGLHGPKPKKKRGRPRMNPAPVTAAEIEGDEDASETDQPPAKRRRVDAEGFAIPDVPNRLENNDQQTASEGSTAASRGRPKGAKNWQAPPVSAAEKIIEEDLQRDIDLALEENRDLALVPDERSGSSQPGANLQSPRSIADSRPGSTHLEEPPSTLEGAYPLYPGPTHQDPPGPRVDTTKGNLGNVSLSPTLRPEEFEDDLDVANCLLSETERTWKEKLWVTANQDWMRQDHAKRIKKELQEAEMREKGLDPSKHTKDGRKKNKGSKYRQGGTRKAGPWGDVSYLEDTAGRGQDIGKKGSAQPQEGEEEGAATNGRDATPATSQHTATQAVSRMLTHRYPHPSRRIDLNLVHKLFEVPATDSSSQTSDAGSSPARRDPTATPGRNTPGVVTRSRHSIAAEKREAKKRELRAQTAKLGAEEQAIEGGSDASEAGPSGMRPASATPDADGEAEPPESRSPSVSSPNPPTEPRQHVATSVRQKTDTAPGQLSSQPHTPASTLSVLDDGSVEEIVGNVNDAEEDAEDEGDYGDIQMRERSVDSEDDADDPEDYVEENEDEPRDPDLDDIFAGNWGGGLSGGNE